MEQISIVGQPAIRETMTEEKIIVPTVEKGEYIWATVHFTEHINGKPWNFEGEVIKTFWKEHIRRGWWVTLKNRDGEKDYPLSGAGLDVRITHRA